ncbi:hypothetical protein F183_A42490 [Bryobacterales bacterium F-183]|nr:hypothetical protein F183_A42490 [Bryobacterales bacterium F-183]
MKKLAIITLLAALIATILSGQQQPVPPPFEQHPMVREGATWVQATTGAFPCAIRGSVKVVATGSVSVRGMSRDDCGFRIKQRVPATGSSEAAARSQMRGFEILSRSAVETSILTITPGEGSIAYLEIEIWVPYTMRETSVNTRFGALKALAVEGSLKMESGGGPVEADKIGGSAILRTAGGQMSIGSIGGALHCYSGGGYIHVQRVTSEAWCDTAGGDIKIGEVTGPLHLTTGGGNIEVIKAGANVSARSLSGIIDIQDAAGIVTAVARGGSIQIGNAKGARCEASGGAIKVRSQDGPLRLSTAIGNILAALVPGAAQRYEDSFLNSESGDVTLLIPSAFGVTIAAMNETPGMRGLIVSEFPEVRITRDGMNPVRAEGAINGGGPLLRVSTASGNIFLKKQR